MAIFATLSSCLLGMAILAGPQPGQSREQKEETWSLEQGLGLAIFEQDGARVASILAAGADPNSKYTSRMTPLTIACLTEPDLDIISQLLDAGADPNYIIDENVSLLSLIIIDRDDPDLVDLLLRHNAQIQASPLASSLSPLAWACHYNRNRSIPVLLNHGADPNAEGLNATPAMLLYLMGEPSPSTTRLFLDSGADPNASDSAGTSLLMYAAGLKNSEHFRMLLDAGASPTNRGNHGTTSLFSAASNQWGPEALKMLLDTGLDPNSRDNEGRTPLMYCRTIGAANALLNAGADINARSTRGLTPLIAIAGGAYPQGPQVCEQLVRLMLTHGADVNAANDLGQTPLLKATWHSLRSLQTVRLLLEAGADPNVIGANEYNHQVSTIPLIYAYQQHKSAPMMSLLLDYGADPEFSPLGKRPAKQLLLNTLQETDPDALRVFCESIDLDCTDTRGNTILHLAADLAFLPSVIQSLIFAGADPNRINHDGKRPIDLMLQNTALYQTDEYELLLSLTEPRNP